jgi:hypothetical protein
VSVGAPPSARRRRGVILGAIAVVVLTAIIFWAVSVVFAPNRDATTPEAFATVKVVKGQVSADLTLNTSAQWTLQPTGYNRAQGVVTGVHVAAGALVEPGTPLYSIGLKPVVVAQGSVPMFRTLSTGANGPDVAQLQTFLSSIKFFSGAPDGKYGQKTANAVKAWQKSVTVDPTGIVEPGDVIFIPALPARVVLDPALVAVGGLLNGGELVVSTLSPSPVFSISATLPQAALMPEGTRVEIRSPSGTTWAAVTGAHSVAESSGVRVALSGGTGAPVCGDECALIPVDGETLLDSRIITVEAADGLVVPSSALNTDPSGDVFLTRKSGSRISVTVVQSARGMSVVEGVEDGTSVRIPANEQSR